MAKDYFQDITPPAEGSDQPRRSDVTEEDYPEVQEIPIRVADTPDPSTRGIRNISAPSRTRPLRAMGAPNRMDQGIRESSSVPGAVPPRPRRSGRLWIWAAASVVVLIAAAILLFAFASTTVTVTPKSRTAVLTSAPLTAREVPNAEVATPDSLSYTVQTFDLDDSEVVPAQGTTHVESKASGSITVYNAYSATPVRLVKNTRFESPDGLIFRAPSEVVVPGKKGSTPGQVNVTVVADQPGEKYNIGPVAKFTLPGLKSTAAMHAGVYAKSVAAFSGGFVGDQPGTAPGALEAATAQVRGRLEAKAHEAALGQAKDGILVFPELILITYESLPNTTEAGSSVRIHQKAHVEVPMFPANAFAQAIAQSAFTDASGVSVTMKPLEDFSVRLAEGAGTQVGILNTVVSGSALIIWNVDPAALATALQGKNNSAFQTTVNGFSSIQEAHARIAPFWKSTFPEDASDIKIEVVEPTAAE